jgi:hypothetical protein
MKVCSRILVLGAAMLAMAIPAAAHTTPGLLNSFEVKRLVAERTPAADARLATHFAALADRYTREAVVNEAQATFYMGNPNHPFVGNMGSCLYCERLSQHARASARITRELASYYKSLAAGVPAEAPRGAAAFQAGEGAPAPTAGEMRQLAAVARTPADHLVLQEYFLTLATQKTVEAKKYASMANMFRVSGQPRGSEVTAMQNDRLAKLAREAAREAIASAALQGQLANIG